MIVHSKALSICAAFLLVLLPASADTARNAEARQVSDVIHEYLSLPSPVERTAAQSAQAGMLVAKLQSFDRAITAVTLFDAIVDAADGRILAKYRHILEQLGPSWHSEFLTRARSEKTVTGRRKLIRLADAFWGRDTVLFLVTQLDDKRSAELKGDNSTHATRVCDIALNVLQRNLGSTLNLRFGVGGRSSDAIVPDVPIPQRDEWIEMFRKALANKYGANLELFDQQGR
jgi:hypothetical protein